MYLLYFLGSELVKKKKKKWWFWPFGIPNYNVKLFTKK